MTSRSSSQHESCQTKKAHPRLHGLWKRYAAGPEAEIINGVAWVFQGPKRGGFSLAAQETARSAGDVNLKDH